MRRTNFIIFLLFVLLITGCGRESAELEVDKDKPLEEVKQQASQLDNRQLREMTMRYKKAIMEKEPEINNLMKKLQDQPLAGTDPEEIKVVQEEITELTESISALKTRYQIYYDALAETGADMTELSLRTK